MILSSEEELSAGRRTKGSEPRGEWRHTQVEAAIPQNPPEGMEGRSWAVQHSSSLQSPHKSQTASPKETSPAELSVLKEGRGPAGEM